MLRGIDLSYANKVTDWNKVKEQVDFIILRAGYGKNNIDQNLVPYAAKCREHLIRLWLYWFSYAYTEEMARNEARYCIAQAEKRGVEKGGRIAFDFEYDSVRYAQGKGINVTKNLVMAMTVGFCKEVENAGYTPVVYTNKDYGNRYFDMAQIKALGYEIWYAYYNKELDRNDVALWQYTSSGSVEGITGNVDMNCLMVSAEKKSGWQKDDDMWWWLNEDGTYAKNEWKQVDGKWYHFDNHGWMQTGWLESEEKWYYLKSDGSMASNEILTIHSDVHGDEMYAFDHDGHMLRTDERGALK